MKLLQFTHANTGQPIDVAPQLLFSFYYSDTHKCVFLLASGGAIIPVKESMEEVRAKVMQTSEL